MGAEGREVAAGFLRAIKNLDAQAFWGLLDKKGQGYFLGMWYLALADADISTIEALAGESEFLNNALRPVMENLNVFLGDLLEEPSFGEVVHLDGSRAVVPIKSAGKGREERVPLVLEMAPEGGALTCWRVDTLRCVNFVKNA